MKKHFSAIGNKLKKLSKYIFRFLKNVITFNSEFKADILDIKVKFSELKNEVLDLFKYFKDNNS